MTAVQTTDNLSDLAVMPRVSVVIPTHDRASLLRPAIQSVLNQTFQDFEIIVVDDASKDETPEVMRSFTDPRIRYLRHDTNEGQGVTRNDGIARAVGEYIALLDDDDEWLPQKLEQQVKLLDSSPSKVGLVYTGVYRINGLNTQSIGKVIPEKRGYVFEEMCNRNWIGTCSTVLVRKSCFEKTGSFDEEFASGADYDMWLRISKDFEVEYIREPLALYRIHGNRISTSSAVHIRGLEAQLRKHASLLARNSKIYSRRYLALGVHYCNEGNVLKGREAFFKAIRIYPFAMQYYYNLCLSLLGAKNFVKLKSLREKIAVR